MTRRGRGRKMAVLDASYRRVSSRRMDPHERKRREELLATMDDPRSNADKSPNAER
jgi:hypothetical protein